MRRSNMEIWPPQTTISTLYNDEVMGYDYDDEW